MASRTRMAAGVRRSLILDAATTLISERGYNGFTLAQLAEMCGLTNPGLLHYFASKDLLLLAVLEHQDGVNEAFVQSMTFDTSTREGARRFLDLFVERNAGLKEIARLYVVLGAEALGEGHPAHQHLTERAQRMRQRSIEMASPWHTDPEGFVTMVSSFLDGLQFDWLRDPAIDLLSAWKTFADLAFADGAQR